MKLFSTSAGGVAEVRGFYATPELVPAGGGVRAQTGVLGLELAPWSTLVWCLACLTALYFAVCTLLIISRIGVQLFKWRSLHLCVSGFESAELVAEFAPMLCVLFVVAQMQSMEASSGFPPSGVLLCMEVATGALVVQTLLMVCFPAITERPPEPDPDCGGFFRGVALVRQALEKLRGGRREASVGVLLLLGTVASYLSMFALYVGCLGVCAGILAMRLPHASRSPMVSCTVNLSVQFFVVRFLCFFAVFVYDAASYWGRQSDTVKKALQVTKLASITVFFAPMLCVLFIAAQVRAMQVDPNNIDSAIQPWTKVALYASTYGVLAQTLLTLILPFLPCCRLDARRATQWMESDVEFQSATSSGNRAVTVILLCLRYIPILFICGGFAVVIAGLLSIRSPGGATTPAVPPAMWCVMWNTVLFFGVYLVLRVVIAFRDVLVGRSGDGGPWVRTFYAASATVHFCPMLAILFVSLRLRAQQITGNQGAPQGWAQDTMYVCTTAVALQLLICLVIPLVTGRAPDVENDIPYVSKEASTTGRWPAALAKAVLAMQAVLLCVIYMGAVAVCVALFVLTPATAGAHDAVIA